MGGNRSTTAPSSAQILFVHNHLSRFIALDRDLLRQRWRVREWHERSRRVNLPALARAVREADVVFGWFASWHTFWPFTLARRMGKPSVLVVGGYDVARMPEIGYGHQRGGAKRWASRWTIRRASALTTFSTFSQQEIERNLGLPPAQVRVIYLGIPDPYGALGEDPREPMALTVGNVDHPNLERKGQEVFVRTAAHLPSMQFVMVGDWRDGAIGRLRACAGPNVRFTGYLDDPSLNDHYRRAAVYVQPSRHEGFGVSVAEAMMGGAVPVVSRAGSLPEVVGEAGVYVSSVEPVEVAGGIRQGLAVYGGGRQARERVLTCFPVERRRRALHDLVERAAAGKA